MRSRADHTFSFLLTATAAAVSALALAACPAAAIASSGGGPASSPPLAIAAAESYFNLAPGDIRAAYSLPKTGAAGQRIAIISAYDDPSVQADLAAYTQRFRVPACTTASGCFDELNQQGAAAPLPGPDPTGGQFVTEASAGVELARGICGSCSITLVEANSSSKADLSAAVSTAAQAGAGIIVTTFTAPEASDDAQYAADYSHPHSVVVSAAGDNGFTGALSFPASLPGVIAVGGTSLSLTAGDRYLGETAWPGTSSGCSLFQAAPAWQVGAATSVGCGDKRAVADIAAVADPGALVHVDDAGQPGGPWYAESGTSFSAPVIAGVIGLAGAAGSAEAARLYQRARTQPGALRDITRGTTSVYCQARPVCAARRGFDGPTGLGTPYGLAAFTTSGGVLDRRHPRVSLTAARGRVHASRRWVAQIGLKNNNAFTVTASLRLRSAQRLRFGGRLQTITFATTRLTLGSLSGATASLHVAQRYRGLLRALGPLAVEAQGSLRGLTGRSVTVTRRVRLYAP